MLNTRTYPRLWPILCLVLAVTACTPAKTVKKSGTGTGDEAREGESATPPGVESSEPDIHGSEFTAIADLQTAHFAYDAYSLDQDSRNILKQNAAYLKEHPEQEVLVAGNCDERGTIEYNLALGQKRAQAVREYYLRLGVPGKSIGTISYGKEKPACTQSTEDCWAQNRRAATLVRARTVSKPRGSKKSSDQ